MARNSPAFEVTGAKEFRKALKAAGADAGDLKNANRDVGEVVVRAAKPLTPNLTGKLAGSIAAAAIQTGVTVKAGGSARAYAGVIHFGWAQHNIEPQPFFYEALDRRRDEVLDAYEEHVTKALSTYLT